jgi:hypothetical protein
VQSILKVCNFKRQAGLQRNFRKHDLNCKKGMAMPSLLLPTVKQRCSLTL